MAAAETTVASFATSEADLAVLVQVAAVWTAAFPTAPGRDRYAEALVRRDGPDTPQRAAEHVHCIFEGGHCVAAARSFVRVVLLDGTPTPVLALAHVATSPAARGRGLGAAVVQEAWKRLDAKELPFSLFCTGVPAFYTKLGAVPYAPARVVYPDGAAPFHDDALLVYFAPGAAPPDAAMVLDAQGDGW
ncbi:acyl-CoA N-acyltransferase [Pelagophyceae sp. CCMP2097]|nr:acyl-CoA N-acyltransferase [Pelagophyceae sp. CCMP2097]|mmetsp:Transcript_20463/g.69362  ORF Transcript_20463/g.69362 Transcript_20463/m.69362 type:complete len:189 (+) Transcript_20463:53-619(+)